MVNDGATEGSVGEDVWFDESGSPPAAAPTSLFRLETFELDRTRYHEYVRSSMTSHIHVNSSDLQVTCEVQYDGG